MYVCVCNAVTERDIDTAMAEGCCTLRQLREQLGGGALLATLAAARLARLDWRRLALGLVPLAGIGLFLGLSMMTATHLRAEGAALDWLPGLRAALLAVGVAWSGWLGFGLLKVGAGGTAAKAVAGLVWLLPLALVAANWWLVFFIW